MSAENVEVVRRLYAALARLDPPHNREALDLLDPDVEWHGTVGGLLEGTVYRGRDEVARLMLEDRQEWTELVFEPREFVDVGDTVVVLHHERRTGRVSGIEVESDTAAVVSVRDGRVWRLQGYMDQQRALAAAGVTD